MVGKIHGRFRVSGCRNQKRVTGALHLRESSQRVTHYVDSRTIVSLCGRSGLDWQLVLDDRRVATCPLCVEQMEKDVDR